ncbi:MAG: hypothetical protein WCK67_01745 [bacterium]
MFNAGLNTSFTGEIHKTKIKHKERVHKEVKVPEQKNDAVELSTKKCAENDDKFTWKEASKNLVAGFVGQGKNMITTMVKNPVATAGGIVGTTALILAAPLVGVSAAAVGTALSVGFLGFGVAKSLSGLAKAVNDYAHGRKDEAEKDFKQVGEGAFDIATIAAPAAIGKTTKIIGHSELGNIIGNSSAAKTFNNITAVITSPLKSIQNFAGSLTSENKFLNSIGETYVKIVNNGFSTSLSKGLHAKLINGLHNNLVAISEKLTVDGVKSLNVVIDNLSPKHVIGSDFHGKKGSLAALASKNPNGKNLHINGDIIDKGQHPVTNEKTNTRDVIKFVNEELPEAKITYGNHEFQVASTQESIYISHMNEYTQAIKEAKFKLAKAKNSNQPEPVIAELKQQIATLKATYNNFKEQYFKIADAKYRNLSDVLEKPSTNFYEEVLKPYDVSGSGLEDAVGSKIVKIFEKRLEGINARVKAGEVGIPESQKALAKLVLKQNKDGTWALKGKAASGNKEFLQEVAAKEFYRFYSNFGGNVDQAAASFAKVYGLADNALPLQKIIYGLREFHSDFAQLKSRMHMFDVIKGGEKGDILLTHAGIPYTIDEQGKTVLLPKAIFKAEENAQQGKFSQMLLDKNESPVYGGEAKGEKNAFWFDRKDVTAETVEQAYNEFSQLHAEKTGQKVNVTRGVIGHETRSNGVLDPGTEGWNKDFEHLLNNTDGVEVTGSVETGDLKVVHGKENLQRRIVSAYDGKLILADAAAGDAADGKLGILPEGHETTYVPGKGPAVKHGDEIIDATRFRHGAGLQVQRDGSIRDLHVRYDGKEMYKSRPGDYIYEADMVAESKKGLKDYLGQNTEVSNKLEGVLAESKSNLSLDDEINSLVSYSKQSGKAESKVRDLISKLCPDNYFETNISNPTSLVNEIIENPSKLQNPTLINAKINVPPTESVEETITHLMKNITSENSGISVIGAKRIPDTNKLELLLGNGTDHTRALRAEIELIPVNSVV